MIQRTRRHFLRCGGLAFASLAIHNRLLAHMNNTDTLDEIRYDAIIIGGSYSGLAAGMALGRALRNVLIIDAGLPCNRKAPYSHNFITHDGRSPAEISRIAREQVAAYDTVRMIQGQAVKGLRTANGFTVELADGAAFAARKLIFATGITDIMPNIDGFTECWGVSVLHCPYCHGYEVRGLPTGVIANSGAEFDYVLLIANWTQYLTVFTNGVSALSTDQMNTLSARGIRIVEKPIARLNHKDGHIHNVELQDGIRVSLDVLYSRRPFKQHCTIPTSMGCELLEEGYIKIDQTMQTSIDGIYACGDNTTPMRTVANAVATGTAVGMHVNKALIA